MADTKISALTAVTTPDAADEFAVNQGGTSKKVTLALIQGATGTQFINEDDNLFLQTDIVVTGEVSFISPFKGITAAYAPDMMSVPLGFFRLQYLELILDGLDETTLNGEIVLFDWGPRDLVVA